MSVKNFLHASILVTDLEKSDYFYREILGFQPVERSLNFPGIWYQIGEVQIHLITATTVVLDQVNWEKYGRNRHLAFAVDNLAEIQQILIAHNYPVNMSASGRPALFTKDPDGNIIELSE